MYNHIFHKLNVHFIEKIHLHSTFVTIVYLKLKKVNVLANMHLKSSRSQWQWSKNTEVNEYV